jgi:hypothetical protein
MLGLGGAVGSARAPYPVPYSCEFNGTDEKLSMTPTEVNPNTVVKLSVWFKRAATGRAVLLQGNDSDGDRTSLDFTASDTLRVSHYDTFTSAMLWQVATAATFTDSLWHHVLALVDTTEAVASDRVKLYVDGSLVSSFSIETYPDEDLSTAFFDTSGTHDIGYYASLNDRHFTGKLAEVVIANASSGALTVDDFGQNWRGLWVPKDPDFTYGFDCSYLRFDNSADLGEATHGVDFTPSGLVAANQIADDSPTVLWRRV